MSNFNLFKSVVLILLSLNSSSLIAKIIPTIIGEVDEQQEVIHELLATKAMQRLKYIDQSGPDAYFTTGFPAFSRYEHSLGVYALLKRFNLPLDEQVAGLLHDSSHTVFSHVGDIVFQQGDDRIESYQDKIHSWYLQQTDIKNVLANYKLTVAQIDPKREGFYALEQEYPDMNADRIEYNLHTGLAFRDINHRQVEDIINCLEYKDKKWFFNDANKALTFAKLSTKYTRTIWGNHRNTAMYTVTAATLKRAIQQGYINKQEMHFASDPEIIEKLREFAKHDHVTNKLLAMLRNIEQHFSISDASDFDVYQPIKMRGIDPLVVNNEKLLRLSELSTEFKKDLDLTQRYVTKGVHIKFHNLNPEIHEILKSVNT